MACKMEFGKKVSHTHRAYPESRQLSRPKKKSGLKQEKKNGGNNDSRKRNQG
jgi:hypothetical protein